jgi:hypothetical protein
MNTSLQKLNTQKKQPILYQNRPKINQKHQKITKTGIFFAKNRQNIPINKIQQMAQKNVVPTGNLLVVNNFLNGLLL